MFRAAPMKIARLENDGGRLEKTCAFEFGCNEDLRRKTEVFTGGGGGLS